MFILPAIIVACFIIGAINFQLLYTLSYRKFLRTAESQIEARVQTADLHDAPKVAIVLCLRGYDPSLGQCLDGVTQQSYENFDLHIAVDHAADPGGSFAKKRLAESGLGYSFHVFDTNSKPGSLKCKALVHVMEKVVDEYEFVVLIDADTAVDSDWLIDLMSPMILDTTISATTGNRWFNPPNGGPGDLVRKIWNGAAIVQMWIYNIPWGGSLAIRCDAISKTNLTQELQNAFCEDTMLPGLFAMEQLRIVRVPQLIVENHESTTLPSAFTWISRQLFSLRHYHGLWPLVFGHAIIVLLCPVSAIVIGIMAWWVGEYQAAIISLGSLLVLQIVNVLLVRLIETENIRVLKLRQRTPKIQPFKIINSGIAIVLTQLIQPLAAISAQFRKRICWRGIEYQVLRRGEVEMIEYRPFANSTETDVSTSIN